MRVAQMLRLFRRQTLAMRPQSINITEVSLGDRRVAAVAHVEIEQLGRIAQVDLVDVVVDRAPAAAGQMRDRKAVVGEPGQPAAAVEADQVAHEIDLVGACGVAGLFHRPDEDPFGPRLRRLGADEDPHRRLGAARHTTLDLEDDALRLRLVPGRSSLVSVCNSCEGTQDPLHPNSPERARAA
jgi:hypothetical protein